MEWEGHACFSVSIPSCFLFPRTSVLPIQIIRIGQAVILRVAGEFTTAAGRRLREAVRSVLSTSGSGEFDNVHVVIAGLTNSYSQYVTTFGNTRSKDMREPQPCTVRISLVPTFRSQEACSRRHSTPAGVKFGDISTDVPVNSTFKQGDTVSATFWSACPSDLMTEGPDSLVELLDGTDTWFPTNDDDDFCLRFKWSRPSKLSTRSHATIEWRIAETAVSGVYRLRHFGAAKRLFGSIRHFTGASRAFSVQQQLAMCMC